MREHAVYLGATVAVATRHRRLHVGNCEIPVCGDDDGLDDGFREKISSFAGVSKWTGHLRATRVIFTVTNDKRKGENKMKIIVTHF